MLLPALIACMSPPATPARLTDVEPAHADLRLVVVGDSGHVNATARRVAASVTKVCAERGCDALVLLGDNLYPRGLTSEADPDAAFGPWLATGLPVYGVLGNHDWGHGHDQEAAAAQVAWSHATPGLHLAQDWTMRAGPATLIGLDTTRVFWDGPDRAAWLRDALDAAEGWRVVLGHHPFRSNGPHGNAGSYEGWSGIPWLSGRSLQRVFDDALCGRADLYLSGHDHSRQWLQHCEVQLIVSGAGSSSTHLVDRGNEPVFAAAEHGFVWLSLGPQLTVAFHDEHGRVEHEGVAGRPRR